MSETADKPKHKPEPRWASENRKSAGFFPSHLQNYPHLYQFLGNLDNVDIYVDLEEIAQGWENPHAQILLVDGFTWTRHTLSKNGAPEPIDCDLPLTFDQMCRLCVMLDAHGLVGPEPSHAAWDNPDFISARRPPDGDDDEAEV